MSPLQEAIKVMVRIRPPPWPAVYRDDKTPNILHCGDKCYTLDHIFSAQSTDQEVFQKVGIELVVNALEGYNNTLFVYGQTGTGKTYTMGGSNNAEGLVQRCVNVMRKKLENSSIIQNYTMKMSYLQIYNETVKDLLTQSQRVVRQNAKLGFYVEGISEVSIENHDEFLRHYKKGTLSRLTKPTQMNQMSSRSHSILTIILETKQCIGGTSVLKTSKLNFVDLAGSEKLRQTGVTGDRKTQAAHINLSLATLRKVISMLDKRKTKQVTHIPYRESVLTKILKDSLGGNSHTIIIGTISAKVQAIPETISTLNFLEGARLVKNETTVNEKVQGNEQKLKQIIQDYEQKIRYLQEELKSTKLQLDTIKCSQEKYINEVKQLQNRILEYQAPKRLFESIDLLEADFFSIAQENHEQSIFQNEVSLKTIHQEQAQETTHKSSENMEKLQAVVKSQELGPSNSNRNSGKLSKPTKLCPQINVDSILKMQITYLKDKLSQYSRENSTYDALLKTIEVNLNNLQFTQAQLNILALQQRQLQTMQSALDRVQKHNEQLIRQYEQQKTQYKQYRKRLKMIDIQTISRQSTLKSNETNLRKQLQESQVRINQILEDLRQEKERHKSQFLQLKELLDSERELKEGLATEIMMLRRQNQNLTQIVEYHDQNTRKLILDLEREFQFEKKEALKKSEQLTLALKDEKEKYIKEFVDNAEAKLQQFIEEIKNLNERNLYLQDEREKLLIDKDQLIKTISGLQSKMQLLTLDLMAEQQNLNKKTRQLQQLQQQFAQNEVELISTLQKDYTQRKVSIEGEQLTIDQLLQRYQLTRKMVDEDALELEALRSREESLKCQCQELVDRVKACQIIIQSASTVFTGLNKQKDQMIQSMRKQVSQLRFKEDEIAMLRNEVDHLKALHKRRDHSEEKSAYQKQVEYLQGQIKQYRSTLQQANKISNQKIEKFYQNWQFKSDQLRKIQRQKKGLEKQLSRYKENENELQKYKYKVNEYENVIRQLQLKVKSINNKCSDRQQLQMLKRRSELLELRINKLVQANIELQISNERLQIKYQKQIRKREQQTEKLRSRQDSMPNIRRIKNN